MFVFDIIIKEHVSIYYIIYVWNGNAHVRAWNSIEN